MQNLIQVIGLFENALKELGVERFEAVAPREIKKRYKSLDGLVVHVRGGDWWALYCVLGCLKLDGSNEVRRELATSVAKCEAFRSGDLERLLQECLPILAECEELEAFDALLPHAMRLAHGARWLSDCRRHDKVERVLALVKENPPALAPEGTSWPVLGEPVSSDREGQNFLLAGVLSALVSTANPQEKAQIRAVLVESFLRAVTAVQRSACASKLAEAGLADDVLAAFTNDAHHGVREAAVIAALRHNPQALFEQFETLLAGDTWPSDSVALLRLEALLRVMGGNPHSNASELMEREPRFGQALVSVWKTWPAHELYFYVEAWINKLPKQVMESLLPKAANVERLLSGEPLEQHWKRRWQAGERQEVWREIVALGADFHSPEALGDAAAVSHWIMEAVRQNLLTLATRYRQLGLPAPNDCLVQVRPPHETAEDLAEFVDTVGSVPLSLVAFSHIVGQVNLQPAEGEDKPHDALGGRSFGELRPLALYGVQHSIREMLRWKRNLRERPAILVGPLRVNLTPDTLVRMTSGQQALTTSVPNPQADAVLDPIAMELVDYLRFAIFGRAGLLGLDPDSRPEDHAFIEQMTASLERF